MNTPKQKQQIQLASFKPDNECKYSSYTRLYREGGFRIEQENLGDKYIFHNYGQGDAELSLSYGSAYIASKIITVKQDATKIKEVGVMGDGINALMTCLELVKRGYKVTLYTSKFPIKKEIGKPANLQQGLQLWYPGGYDNCDPLKHELLAKLSFQFFTQCLLANRYQSLKPTTCYMSPSRSDDLKQNVTQYINSNIYPIEVGFDNEKMEEFVAYKTIMIDTRLFLEEIFTEVRLRNIGVVQKRFTGIADVMAVKEKCVFNCLGDEIRAIFGDSAIYTTRGGFYTIGCQNTPHTDNLSLWISSQSEIDQDYTIAISKNKLQINTQSTKQIDPPKQKQLSQRILSRAYHFIKQRTIKPYKL